MSAGERSASRTVWVVWDHDAERPIRGAKTHAASCYVVDPNRPGEHHEFRSVTIADLPEDLGRCEICGGGRPPDSASRRQPAHQGNTTSQPLPDDVIGLGSAFTAQDEQTGDPLNFILVDGD